jgi:3D (Asp-Asp-Asp) domain-containing protein
MRRSITYSLYTCILLLICFAFTGDARQDTVTVTVTAYSPGDSGTITASGKRAKPGMLAISRDLERLLGLRFGDRVRLVGYGTFPVEDRMARRWKRRVDVRVATHREARQFGIRHGIPLQVLIQDQH